MTRIFHVYISFPEEVWKKKLGIESKCHCHSRDSGRGRGRHKSRTQQSTILTESFHMNPDSFEAGLEALVEDVSVTKSINPTAVGN